MAADQTIYWTKREAQERAIADRTSDPVAKRLHAELADLCLAKCAPATSAA